MLHFLYTEVSRFCDKSPAVSVLFSSYRFSYSFRSRQWRSNRVCKACSARGPVAAGDPDEPYVWKREALLESLLRHWFLLTKILRLLVVGVYYSDKKFLQKWSGGRRNLQKQLVALIRFLRGLFCSLTVWEWILLHYCTQELYFFLEFSRTIEHWRTHDFTMEGVHVVGAGPGV